MTNTNINPNTIIGSYAASLRKGEQTKLFKVLSDTRISSKAVAEALCANGCQVASRTVRDFRKTLSV